MSTYGPFGGSSSFYSEPHPERVGNEPAQAQAAEQPEPTRNDFSGANESPAKATPPAYTHYSANADDFAPATMIDPEVVETAGVMAPAPPSGKTLAMLAGAAFLAFLLFKDDL